MKRGLNKETCTYVSVACSIKNPFPILFPQIVYSICLFIITWNERQWGQQSIAVKEVHIPYDFYFHRKYLLSLQIFRKSRSNLRTEDSMTVMLTEWGKGSLRERSVNKAVNNATQRRACLAGALMFGLICEHLKHFFCLIQQPLSKFSLSFSAILYLHRWKLAWR